MCLNVSRRFTESKTIPGLILRYNVHDSVFEAGLPLLRSKEVAFLDGNQHEVGYTFKEGGEQKTEKMKYSVLIF